MSEKTASVKSNNFLQANNEWSVLCHIVHAEGVTESAVEPWPES